MEMYTKTLRGPSGNRVTLPPPSINQNLKCFITLYSYCLSIMLMTLCNPGLRPSDLCYVKYEKFQLTMSGL